MFIASGFLKKFVAHSDLLYYIVSSLPFVYVIAILRFNFRRLLILIIALIVIGVFSIDYMVKLIPSVIIISVGWDKLKHDLTKNKLVFIVLLCFGYGLYQKIFGYSWFEWKFILSEIGSVASIGTTYFDELRAMSFFNQIQTFALFSALTFFFSLLSKSKLLLVLSLCSLFLAGSRGIILATGVSFLLFFLKSNRISIAFLFSVSFYIGITLLPLTGFLEWKDDGNRLLVYGTFNYRVSMLLDYVDGLTIMDFLFGLTSPRVIYDNIYLHIVANAGIISLVIVLILLKSLIKKKQENILIISLIVAYGFYSDLIFDLYLLFMSALFLETLSNSNNSYKSDSNKYEIHSLQS